MESAKHSFIVARGVASFLVALLFVATSVELDMAQSDPLIGTWKLNLVKSQYSPGPPPSSETVMYESAGQGFKYTVRQTDAEGKSTLLQGSLIYDGKDYPATGTPDYDTVATKRIDAYSGETDRKKSGKAVQAGHCSGFASVYSPRTVPSTPSSWTRPRVAGGSSAE